MLPAQHPELTRVYDSLWNTALQGFVHEGVHTDPHLYHPAQDRRRGLTLIARPSRAVAARIAQFLGRIATVVPGQYRYPPESLHLTVLALFTATEQFEPYYEQLQAYRSAVERVLRNTNRFTVVFRGITASQSSIMVQGFPQSEELNVLRDALRGALAAIGLAGGLDTRYRLTTAHMTVLRFQTQPPDIEAMLRVLRAYREHEFGATTIERLELVKNDWYMRPDRVEVVARYRLGEGTSEELRG